MAKAREINETEEALRVLQAFNAWWVDKPFRNPPFRRLAFHASHSLLLNKDLRRAILLSGPRRVGKTTVLMQIAEDLVRQGVERCHGPPDRIQLGSADRIREECSHLHG